MIMPIRPNVPDKKAGIEIFNSLRYGRFLSGIFAYIWQLISRYVPTPAARAAIKINIAMVPRIGVIRYGAILTRLELPA